MTMSGQFTDNYNYSIDGGATGGTQLPWQQQGPFSGMDDDSQYNFNHVSNKPPPSAYMQQTGGGMLRSAKPGSRAGGTGRETARPMTSNKGAGYTAAPKTGGNALFDPLKQGEGGARGPAPPLQAKIDLTPEEKLRKMEKEIHGLVEQSAILRDEGDFKGALEKGKEAGVRERQLCRLREQENLLEQLNIDLTYCVCLNLAIQHQVNDNDNEALTIYTQIVKNKQYPHSGRFRVNMGNIYFKQTKYTAAIKMYRMALDQIPNENQHIRFKLMRNIGHAFFKMHQFPDAIDSYENLVTQGGEHLDFMTGFNLMLCYYALGDKDKMKTGFVKLLSIDQIGLEDIDEDEIDLDTATNGKSAEQTRALEGDDALREDIKRRQREAAKYILNAANLIAPVIEKTPAVGYDWLIESLNAYGFPRVASEIELAKASHYLRHKEFDKAITTLKKFEKKEPSLLACASTNLSFLYFLEGDHQSAEKYANIAVKADRYNARALVNKGNCLFMNEEFEHAKEVFLEAIGVNASCLEAIYNLGLVNMHMGRYQEAILAFDKLQSITHDSCEVMWQLGDVHEKLGNNAKAQEWFSLLVTSPKGRQTDPGVLARIANLFNKNGDETQAFHYNLEAHKYWPVDMNVITWLGIYYVKQEMYEAAMPFFDRAAQIEPKEVKWRLMVASCWRRMGDFSRALKVYEDIHQKHPNDIECVRYLITICKEMGLKYDHYAMHLRKLERLADQQMQQQQQHQATMSHPGASDGFGGYSGGDDMNGGMASPQAPGEIEQYDDANIGGNGILSGPTELYEAADPEMKKTKGPKKRIAPKRDVDDDNDWGNDELDDELLPM
eukprot:gnl/MRDRNA2_/MRDRNA2_94806_c0_seq1.p1 gnl/MRDRNA2_/MRDRNA2_94806_c0~~gnl/MRDRNA2_/MRDRNA2_94806_c0_seq1.p1  ORF type:complete len:835 (+),score=212.77 gnl/MRDRNA2_/MRDRNA2_94806_c0_seq1:95-2599(+)